MYVKRKLIWRFSPKRNEMLGRKKEVVEEVVEEGGEESSNEFVEGAEEVD
jgi:hypothetical protein